MIIVVVVFMLTSLPCSIYRRQHSPKASMKKMFILTTTQLFGVHGGRIINGVTSAASS